MSAINDVKLGKSLLQTVKDINANFHSLENATGSAAEVKKLQEDLSAAQATIVAHTSKIDDNTTKIETNAGKIKTNEANITAANQAITAETSARTSKDEELEGKIADETSARTVAETAIRTSIKSNTDAIAANKSAAENALASAKTELQGNIDLKADQTSLDDGLAKKADKATTLAGYNIGDAYTKTETDGFVKYTNATPIVQPIGGIHAGDTFENMDITAVLNKLLYPYVAPVVSITPNPNGGTFEKGTTATVSALSVAVTKKAREITKVEVKVKDGAVVSTKTDGVAAGGTFNMLPSGGLSVTTQTTYVATVTDSDNKTTTANSGTFYFVDPYFHGTVQPGAAITSDVIKGLTKVIQGKGSKTFTYNTSNSCMVIAYPKSYGVLKSALDPNKFENIASYTRSEVTVNCASGNVVYYVYVKEPSTASGFSITYSY